MLSRQCPPESLSESVRKQWEGPAEQLVRYLLLTNEVPLESPIAGTSGFAEEFAARGPRDSRGRSLRDFASLSSQDPQAVLEILVATKPGLPVQWKEFVRDANPAPGSRPLAGISHQN